MNEHTEHKPNPFFTQFVEWVISHPRRVLTFSLVITAIFFSGIISQLSIKNSLEMFTPPDSSAIVNREDYRDLFGRDDLFMISARGEVFSESYLNKIKSLEDEISRLNIPIKSIGQRLRAQEPDNHRQDAEDFTFSSEFNTEGSSDDWSDEDEGSIVEETNSIVSVRRTFSQNGALKVTPWFDPIPQQEAIDQLKKEALNDPLLAERLINREGSLSVILIRVTFMSDDDMLIVYKALDEICQRHQSEGFKLRVTGAPAITAALNMVVIDDLSKLLGFSGLAMFLALLYLFRSRYMVIGPIVVVGLSVVWTMGFMAFSGMSLNILSSILPAFLLCVGLGDSIHFQSIYQGLRRQNTPSRDGIVLAGGITGTPILFTSLTTMIGLLSFQFASVTAIQEMGLAGGLGVMFALLHSLITLPLFLLWQGEKGAPTLLMADKRDDTSVKGDRIDRALEFFISLSRHPRGRGGVFLIGFLLLCTAIYGAGQLEVWHDDLETLPDHHPIKSAVLEVDHELGGVANIQILINAEKIDGGVKNIRVLRAIDELSQHVLNYTSPSGEKIVGHALSINNIVKETGRALHTSGETYQLPTGDERPAQEEASQLISLFELQSPDQLRRLSTIDLSQSHITFQVKWQEATSYTKLIEHISLGLEKYLEPLGDQAVVAKPTGGVYLAYTVITSLLSDLVRSFLAAFAVITVLMILMLRGVKLGLLAMIPNLFPIILMIGTLGLIGIPLDLNNLLIASIALGIAVDDTIHLLHHFQASYQKHHDTERAISDSVRHAGRAMLSTSILLCVGFSVYLFASTEAVSRFGVVISATVMVALLVDLIICPAILRVAYR